VSGQVVDVLDEVRAAGVSKMAIALPPGGRGAMTERPFA